MGFSLDNGYVPETVEEVMELFREEINTQFGTTYTLESFVGTDFYKYFYAGCQEFQRNGTKASEIFLKLQQYIVLTNQRINRSGVTGPGFLERVEAEGYVASLKRLELSDRGTSSLCVDDVGFVKASGSIEITSYANLVSGTDDSITIGATVFTAQSGAASQGDATFQAASDNDTTAASLADQINDHATAGSLVSAVAVGAVVTLTAIDAGTDGNSIALAYTDNDTNVGATVSGSSLEDGAGDTEDFQAMRLEICNLQKQYIAEGIVTLGTEEETLTLSNGQARTYKFFLPDRIPVALRLTLALSENNQMEVLSPDDVKTILLDNIASRYRLGKNFEPDRYFSVVDAPWAESVTLEWTDDVTGNDVDPGAVWNTTVFDADFDELFDIKLERLEIVET